MRTDIDHPLAWVIEPLRDDPSCEEGRMFGCHACYHQGLLKIVLAAGEEPWNGVLIATSKQHQDSLIKELPGTVSHPVLGKWLYLPEAYDAFALSARKIVELAKRGDPRIGVAPKEKKQRKPKRRLR